jgi:tRNA threonylcarbamoyladenosine modification (KEOPS) complex  Pcc1 subunit
MAKAKARFSAIITLPVNVKGLVKSGKRGRGATKISSSSTATTLKIGAADIASFKATLNSALRDITVVESVSRIPEYSAKPPDTARKGKSI